MWWNMKNEKKQLSEEQQVPGQMSIEDYPEYLPEGFLEGDRRENKCSQE